MRYGEIYWAEPDPAAGSERAGRRPVLVISSDEAIAAIPNIITTIPITTRERGWATHIPITGPATGLAEASWALCEQIRTISTRCIATKLGEVDADTLAGVTRVSRYLLNL